MADQGVVGVVPFGPLRVQPDTTAEDEVAQLGKQRHQQFFQQRNLVYLAAPIKHQLAVGAAFGDPLFDAIRKRVIKNDRVLRVFEEVLE